MKSKTSIKSEIYRLLDDYPESKRFIKTLSTVGELIFFGGSIRDYYFNNGYTDIPRDFDIAIKLNYDQKGQFEDIVGQQHYRKNRFGGYKVNIENIEFDIWNFEDTWAFRKKKLTAEEKNLIKSVYLSIDGIAYNFNQDTLYDQELKWSIENKLITIVLKDNPQKNLNLLRALVFKKRYGFELSNELKEEYRKSLDVYDNFYKILYNLQYSHYRQEYLTEKEVLKELEYIKL